MEFVAQNWLRVNEIVAEETVRGATFFIFIRVTTVT